MRPDATAEAGNTTPAATPPQDEPCTWCQLQPAEDCRCRVPAEYAAPTEALKTYCLVYDVDGIPYVWGGKASDVDQADQRARRELPRKHHQFDASARLISSEVLS